ncbi:MAG: CheY-P-specific phosphatase CheC [Clostridia bacterium]|nr:chemotaxis protein CheC [Candidatus Pelethousia sp.]NCB31543.1 CheY-P-specific phosphatase CheC [Clostridia bacterium]
MAIDPMMMDVLKEIGNIGTGNAATALATMLDTKVDIGLPQCEMVPFSEITRGFSSPDELVVGVLVQLSGDMDGFIMMILTLDAAFELLSLITGQDVMCLNENYAAACSALKPIEEIGNILIGAYLSAISGMTGMAIIPSVPALSVDMVMAMMNVPAVVYGEVGESVLHMETQFHNDLSSITGRYFLVPTMDSYDRLMKALGL